VAFQSIRLSIGMDRRMGDAALLPCDVTHHPPPLNVTGEHWMVKWLILANLTKRLS
jgi:hypothetical protein